MAPLSPLSLTADRRVGASGILDIGRVHADFDPGMRCRVSVEVNRPDWDRTYVLVIEDEEDEDFDERVGLGRGRTDVSFEVELSGCGPLMFGLVRTMGTGSSTFDHVTVTVTELFVDAEPVELVGSGWDDDPLSMGRAEL